MIIFGSKVISTTIKAGKFNCPNCRREQTYQLKSYKKFFHFFFIPLLKIKELGEQLDCFFCQTSYVPGSVLSAEEYEVNNPLLNSTGATVALIGLTPADFGKRIGAFILDIVIIYVVYALSIIIAPSVGFLMIFISFVYFLICDIVFKGSSVGKLILSIKVADYNEGEKVLVFSLIIRNLIKGLCALFPPLFLTALFNQEKRALHDLAAQTIVVDK
jgi:uncharacterized RDD family membrane protein YckC